MMDTILLIIGIIGFSISVWVLRGYLINTPSALTKKDQIDKGEPEQTSNNAAEPVTYVTLEEHQKVLARLAELERGSESASKPILQTDPAMSTPGAGRIGEKDKNDISSAEPEVSEAWQKIFALQEAYRRERERERETDYEREQSLFDLSEGFDGQFSPNTNQLPLPEEERMNQRLLDNQLEDGEALDVYQARMNQFAQLTKEVLVTRLDVFDKQLREQQERHQAMLLTIIRSLIDKTPGDANLKSVVQSSYVAASKEISNEDSEPNRISFAEMFSQHVGK
ncbi:hypothetical protein BN8_p06785 (plasmid) [Fibrisoma limi BUZ 3]|uniref:Uncharacterized protein n=1 Tax=Fibrisoma limi BUZ 3 TaxID=1185876 RepID=I2GTZ1_9BACT|nr:hypothetical protein [Fibrisoma limi]CCH57592.1 hypothetical protein BN8_p06785 [Fibrisoma limi BUZ 3]